MSKNEKDFNSFYGLPPEGEPPILYGNLNNVSNIANSTDLPPIDYEAANRVLYNEKLHREVEASLGMLDLWVAVKTLPAVLLLETLQTELSEKANKSPYPLINTSPSIIERAGNLGVDWKQQE